MILSLLLMFELTSWWLQQSCCTDHFYISGGTSVFLPFELPSYVSTVYACLNKVEYPFGVACMSLSDGVSEPAPMKQLSTGGVTSSSILLDSMSCKEENEIYLEIYFPQWSVCDEI